MLPPAREKIELKTTGFIKPTDDFMESRISIQNFFQDKPSTFFFKIKEDKLNKYGVFAGDLAFVDRSLQPRNNDIIIAVVDGEFVCRRFYKRKDVVYLLTDSRADQQITLSEFTDASLWGVVAFTVRRHRLQNRENKECAEDI